MKAFHALPALALLAACGSQAPRPVEKPETSNAAAPANESAVAEPVAPAPSPARVLTAAGFDTIRIGEAPAAATGYALGDDGNYDGPCRIYFSKQAPGLAALVEDAVVRRVTLYTDRDGASPVRTERGIGVGSTEAEVRAAYSPLGETAHKYSPKPGKNLVYGEEGMINALRFEIGEDGKVSELHAGASPQLMYAEGCS